MGESEFLSKDENDFGPGYYGQVCLDVHTRRLTRWGQTCVRGGQGEGDQWGRMSENPSEALSALRANLMGTIRNVCTTKKKGRERKIRNKMKLLCCSQTKVGTQCVAGHSLWYKWMCFSELKKDTKTLSQYNFFLLIFLSKIAYLELLTIRANGKGFIINSISRTLLFLATQWIENISGHFLSASHNKILKFIFPTQPEIEKSILLQMVISYVHTHFLLLKQEFQSMSKESEHTSVHFRNSLVPHAYRWRTRQLQLLKQSTSIKPNYSEVWTKVDEKKESEWQNGLLKNIWSLDSDFSVTLSFYHDYLTGTSVWLISLCPWWGGGGRS